MHLDLMIIDNFYQNPDATRAFALSQDYTVTGNFPGARTKSFLTPEIKSCIQHFMNFAGNITNWFEEDGYTGSFQYTTARDRTWIHCDHTSMWAGVCYLNPEAPVSGGTAIYRHKETGEYRAKENLHEAYDYTKWDKIDIVGNKYNRLVIYKGDLFHASLDYFGKDLYDGRLFQTFFFDTERYS
jgi:hypothetical protein